MVPRMRVPIIIISLFALFAIGVLLWAAPRWTRADRDRLDAARSAPWHKLHLVDTEDSTPSHYYVDIRMIAETVRSEEYADPPLDTRGVPIVDYVRLGAGGIDERMAYNPVTISQYGLARYEEFLHGDAEGLADMLVQANWLRSAMDENGRLEYEFAITTRDLEPGWISAMAQGEAISVFARAWAETEDPIWLEAADRAFRPFTSDLARNGVVFTESGEEGSVDTWLEEYPHDPPSHVLNGAMFAAFGLYDLTRIPAEESAAAAELLKASSDTLARSLGDYEEDGWVLYQLTGGAYATKTYYGLHIDQLRAMESITGDSRFGETADSWVYPLDHPRLWLLGRTWTRMLQRLDAHL